MINNLLSHLSNDLSTFFNWRNQQANNYFVGLVGVLCTYHNAHPAYVSPSASEIQNINIILHDRMNPPLIRAVMSVLSLTSMSLTCFSPEAKFICA